jgi:hypothetical protein
VCSSEQEIPFFRSARFSRDIASSGPETTKADGALIAAIEMSFNGQGLLQGHDPGYTRGDKLAHAVPKHSLRLHVA